MLKENAYQSNSSNVYLLVTDLHWKESSFEGRLNYKSEMDMILNKIYSLVLKYKDMGKKVYLLFMGDIYHNSFKSASKGAVFNNLMILLQESCDGVYSVLGNHEITYYEENPFWTLLTKVDSEKVMGLIHKIWSPTGVRDTISVVDELVDGDVRFVFNHYAMPVTIPAIDGKTNIGLFHIDLYAKAIVEDMKMNMGLDVFEHDPVYFDGSRVLYGYDYAYFGHMHKLYGMWDYICDSTGYKTKLHYLASLGRTNVTEIMDSFLERDIPAIHVTNGKLELVESNKFNLPSREESVNERLVERNKEVYLLTKEKRNAKKYYVATSDDPIQNLRNNMTEDPLILSIFEELLDMPDASFEKDLLKEIEKIKCL